MSRASCPAPVGDNRDNNTKTPSTGKHRHNLEQNIKHSTRSTEHTLIGIIIKRHKKAGAEDAGDDGDAGAEEESNRRTLYSTTQPPWAEASPGGGCRRRNRGSGAEEGTP